MAGPRYTIDELVRLRESPLVQRPDRLPSIEEWLEYVSICMLYCAIKSPADMATTVSHKNQANASRALRAVDKKSPRPWAILLHSDPLWVRLGSTLHAQAQEVGSQPSFLNQQNC